MGRRRTPAETGFVLFDVVYESGAKSSRRRVPASAVGTYEGDAPVKTLIMAQDRKIAEVSGLDRGPIKTITRSPL
jgi:hypothetical protein